MTFDKSTLREQLLAKRKALSHLEQAAKSQALLTTLEKLPEFRNAHTVAAYWPHNGEISSLPIIEQAALLGKWCYLPILTHNQLAFGAYVLHTPLTVNRFGIPEPVYEETKTISPYDLDLVFVPLVAFTKTGLRLGMGKGYYDHTFSFLHNTSTQKPFLCGLAYDFQEIDTLEIDSWDISIQAVLTETRCISTRPA